MRKNPARLSALLGGACLLAGCASGPQTQALAPAGFDRVTVGGELRQRIERNFDRLETDYYQPDQVYWTEEQSGGWPGDKEGRTILALVLDAQASGRTPLYLDELIRRLPRELNAKGYLGSILEGSADEQQLSGHGWLLRGLCEYYAWKKDPQVLEIARGIVDSLFLPIAPLVDRYPLSEEQRVSGAGDMSGRVQNTVDGWALSSDVGCVFIGMEGLIHSFQYIPSEESKALIDKLIALFERMDLTGIRAQTHASLTALRGMLRYAALTGDTTLIPRVEKRWKLYKEYGMTENYENYNWFERYDTWTEPCAIVDSYLLATQLWAATRNPTYLEDADKIYLNGIAATQRHNGGFGCDKPVGVVYPELGIHADEAYWCCTMRGGEGLGRAAEYAYFTEGNRIVVPFYRESRLQLPDRNVVLEQRTDYPFGDRIEFRFAEKPDKEVSLALVVPSYMQLRSLTLNGHPVEANVSAGFAEVAGPFSAGDRIELEYGFAARWVPLENRDITDRTLYKAMYGPLVLAYEGEAPLHLDGETPILADGDGTFRIEGTPYELSPVYHLMSPKVCLAENYRPGITVRID